MIIIIVGGIGSGKTLSAVKDIIQRDQLTFTNFQLFQTRKIKRLKYEHLFFKDEKSKKMKLNFSFWNELTKKYGGFDIVLDEFHNVMSSRRAMSKRNVLLSDWLSQIRKILGQSEKNNLVLITQKLRRIDVNSRDLAHLCIYCMKRELPIKIETMVKEHGRKKLKLLPVVMIYRFYFDSPESLLHFQETGARTYFRMTRFIANDYYQFFNSYELIDFGSEEYV